MDDARETLEESIQAPEAVAPVWRQIYEHALPKDAPGAWIRAAIEEAQLETGRP